MSEKNLVLEDMDFKELSQMYEVLLERFDNCETDSADYRVIESKLDIIEKLLEEKRPQYFKNEEDELEYNIRDSSYTIREVSKIFNVTRQTVYNWINAHIIPCIKIGGKTYISKTVIEKVIENGTQPKQDD